MVGRVAAAAPRAVSIRLQRHIIGRGRLCPCPLAYKSSAPRGRTVELYDTPWEDEPKLVFFHSDECEEAYIHADSFGYRDCASCERTICQQHPGNGWQWQFCEHEDLVEICLRCYQDEILENGQPRSDFESVRHRPPGTIKGGMFFSYGNAEPKKAGFDKVQAFAYYFVNHAQLASRYNDPAKRLLKTGACVITCYQPFGLAGHEGSVTMTLAI